MINKVQLLAGPEATANSFEVRFGAIAASPLKPNAGGCALLVQQRTFGDSVSFVR